MLNKMRYPAFRPGNQSSPWLDGVLTSAVFDLDATIAASYSGSGQGWSNLVAAPADGTAQAAYDFYLGNSAAATAADPTFTGSAGSAAAYWSFDGGDYFQAMNAPSWLANVQRTDIANPATFIVAFRTASTSFHNIFGHLQSGTAANGYSLRIASGQLQYFGRGNSSNVSYNISGAGALSASTDYLLIVSLNVRNGAGKYWLNNRTGTAFTPAASTSTAAATGNFQAGSSGFGSSPLPSGSRLYACGGANAILDDAAAALVFDHYNARHARTYA